MGQPARTNASYREVAAAAQLRCNTGIASPLTSTVPGILHPAKADASYLRRDELISFTLGCFMPDGLEVF